MRPLLALLLLWPLTLHAQTRAVDPDDLQLTVTVLEQADIPYAREMVMIVIRGVYKRHITLEKLEQPDLPGFNWTQLGPDTWREERIRGQKVKVLERRMALYPERAGTLTIGAFTHHLTLTDEGDDWFEHDITSAPVTIEVAPAPALPDGGWWFPARRVQVADNWSNAPDQLTAGEGVLRIVRVEAVGVTPEMVPPMPELTSPSAMIFPHPEKRLIQLSPEGPVTYVFWRWTIRPTNDRSTIVEPIGFSYFDTVSREMREVVISAQRVAYDEAALPPPPPPEDPARLPGWPMVLAALAAFGAGLAWMLKGQRADQSALLRRLPLLDPQVRALRRAARAGDAAATRRAARAILRRDGVATSHLLDGFDRARFGRQTRAVDLRAFATAVLRART
ncbi:BatD family protein [Sagittula stellata]|uniref:BatD protein n=1 Tax=Sagittula stellata (strain ATCC 700073 / DSM 11524 / E-37) TaxID=388399 RepID=A3K7J0_SAGS3|nr:BatD family protein [Sagittula stellata]EBA06949.1 hypothetical protein SSE37_00720 [Sagittula stellata E-37]